MSVDMNMQPDSLLEDQLMPTGDISGDGLPRDGHGRYILPHPVTGEKKGRTRVTTLASLGSSGVGLAIDRERKVVGGMGYRPDLCARAAAAHSGIDSDPNAKKLLSEIAEAAYIQAGGNAGANYGTAQHAVFEQYFLHGVPKEKLAEYFHADIEAVEKALAFYQLRILPRYIERVVYSILYDRGGKTDAIVEHIPTGDLYIFDLKTEEDPIAHPQGKTIQLAYYANADCTFNYDTGQWEPMPKVRTDVALIVHVRPGKGAETDVTKCILTVPIDQGWAGVRIVEMMRAWRQQKLVIAPFMSQANWMPPAPVNTNGDVAVASGIITNTPETPWQQQITENTPQPAQLACICATAPQEGQTHHPLCPKFNIPTSNDVPSATANPAPVPSQEAPTPNGVHAQVSQLVDQAIASGQQLSLEQIADLNLQAVEVLSQKQHPRQGNSGLPPAPNQPPGQPVVGPGTPHTIHAGIDSQVSPNEKPEGVPDTRPPAPKSALDKMSPAEHLKQLLDVPPYIEGNPSQGGQGVNPEAEIMELAVLPKPRLQELIRLVSGNTVSEDSLKRHKKPLAEMLVPMLDEQRRMRHGAPQTQPAQRSTEVINEVAASTNGVIDLTFEGVIKAINESVSPDQLNAIYNQVIAAYGPNGWHPDFNAAASDRYAELTVMVNN